MVVREAGQIGSRGVLAGLTVQCSPPTTVPRVHFINSKVWIALKGILSLKHHGITEYMSQALTFICVEKYMQRQIHANIIFKAGTSFGFFTKCKHPGDG